MIGLVSYLKLSMCIGFSMVLCNASAQSCDALGISKASSVEYLVNGSSTLNYSIVKEGDRIYSIYKAANFEMKSYTICRNDTLFMHKAESPQFITNGTDTTGVSFYGVAILPLKLKVGDSLYSCFDYTTNDYQNTVKDKQPKRHHPWFGIMMDYTYIIPLLCMKPL
jgi:hypothetical protein